MRSFKVLCVCLLLLFALNTACCAEEAEETDYYSSFYQSSGANELKDDLPDNVRKYLNSAGIDASDYNSMLSASPQKIAEMFMDAARGSFDEPIKDMIVIAGLVLLAGIMKSVAGLENFSATLNIAVGCAVAAGVFASSARVISEGVSAVSMISDFMLALIPVLAGIITACGNPTLALTYNSLVLAAAQTVSQLAENIVIPLCGAFLAFGVSASLSPDLKLTKLSELIKKTAVGTLSFITAAFSALLGLKSLLAGSADGLVSKSVRLALSSAVPIVGGALSDAYSSIVGSIALLKNTVGVFAVLAVLLIALPIVVQLTVRILLLKLLGVLSGSMGDDTTGEVLDTLGSALTVINSVVIFSTALFIISIGLVISIKTAV